MSPAEKGQSPPELLIRDTKNHLLTRSVRLPTSYNTTYCVLATFLAYLSHFFITILSVCEDHYKITFHLTLKWVFFIIQSNSREIQIVQSHFSRNKFTWWLSVSANQSVAWIYNVQSQWRHLNGFLYKPIKLLARKFTSSNHSEASMRYSRDDFRLQRNLFRKLNKKFS